MKAIADETTFPGGTAADIVVRDAAPQDYGAYARLFPALGPEFAVPAQAQWLAGMYRDAIVAEQGGRVIGYVLGVPFGTVGHVSQLVVEGEVRRAGIGQRLMASMAERLGGLGCSTWQLNVKRTNVAAYRLYERIGFRRLTTCSWITLAPPVVESLPTAAGASVRPIDPAEDGALDEAFALRPGNLAWARRQGGNRLHRVVGAQGETQGIGVYLEATRFLVLLRVRRAELLRPLLLSFGAGTTEDVRVAVEEDDALRDLLLERGGFLGLETDRLVAPLPPSADTK